MSAASHRLQRSPTGSIRKKNSSLAGYLSRIRQDSKAWTYLAVKISIIIPAFNEERLLGQSLAQINLCREAFAKRGWESELIICDNNSTDQTAEIARAAGTTVVFEPVNQIGRARNRGASTATGDWLLFIDADSRPSVELFADVADQIALGRCLAGGSTLRLEGNHRIASLLTWMWNWASRMRGLLAGSFIFCETSAASISQ